MIKDKPPAVYYPPCLLICANMDVFETECTCHVGTSQVDVRHPSSRVLPLVIWRKFSIPRKNYMSPKNIFVLKINHKVFNFGK